ncbi:MAG: histidinol-phosphate transaminase [Pseudomonadota bacterium]
MIRANPHIAQMAPYGLPKLGAPSDRDLISLSQNESLRPPSPMALVAAAEALASAALYPDPGWTALRHSLAEHHGLPADQILCSAGSLDLIGGLARVHAGPGRAVLAPAHAYPFFRTAAQLVNARFDTAEEVDCTVDVDALLAAVRDDTALVFVANPANPTGTRLPRSELERLRAGLPEPVLLVIDEAYGEFADHLDEPSWPLVEAGNIVVLRTFSKAYGLAGLRVGWGLFPPVIAAEMPKALNPNALPMVAQAAALAALEDQAYMHETRRVTADLRDRAAQALAAAGFAVLPSLTNFLLIRFDSAEAAEHAEAALCADGIILRRQQAAGLPEALRMTIGPEPALQAAIDRLKRWKAAHRTRAHQEETL